MFSVSKKKIPLLVILAAAFIGALVVMLPQSLEFILQKVQLVIHRTLRKPEKWISILCSCSRVAIFFILSIAFLNFTTFGEKISARVKAVSSDFFVAAKENKSFFYIGAVFVFLIFCFYRVLDADFLYADDVFRHVSGDRSWIEYSRYVSEFLSMVFHTGRKISDIAPLAQVFAIAFMTFEVALLSYILADKISLPLMFALSLVFINPLFSQCISYRYDAPYMVLSMIFPTAPFLFCKGESENNWIFAAVSVFFLVLCNMAYQAGANIYIILAVFEVYRRLQNNSNIKKTLIFILTAVLSFAAALLLFKVALMVPQDNEGYVSTALNFSAAGKNLATYIKSVFSMFGGKWTKLFLVLVLAISFFVLLKKSTQKLAVSILFTAAAFFVSILLSFGAYLIFDRPLFQPRAYMGFGFLVGLLSGCIFIVSPKIAFRVPVVALIFGCVVFYYAYGNALRDQRIYQEFRTETLLSDLNKFADPTSKKKITVSGRLGHSKGFETAAKTFPIIKSVVSSLPAGGATWNDEILNFYNFNCEDGNFSADHGFPLLLSTNYHDIYGSGNNFYIVLK